MKGMMKVKLVIALLVVIAVAIFYYVSLPAINIHATETWKFIFLILAVLFVLYIVRKAKIAGQSKIELSFIKEYTGLKIGVIVFLLFWRFMWQAPFCPHRLSMQQNIRNF